ncbi:hypothetical protein N7478_006013 [Penicillium angulare]|uniref:uncharacterized protein n=1 Tax=Penicillium angulare TaxID=116970 RepID=UPI00254114F9|nr:uncharacterized protein N7478_006013 [Penicillium angulare]KAJ5280641.1 hypothetical protein N7478_006013 [Penicillium angulare]
MSQGYPPHFARHGNLTSSYASRKRSHTRVRSPALLSSRLGMKSNIPNKSAKPVTNRATAFDLSRFERLHLNNAGTTTQSVMDQEVSSDRPQFARPDSNVAVTNPRRGIDRITASNLSRFALNSPSRTYLPLPDDLVTELNRKNAAIRNSYDLRTIARDILIAADKHPTCAGLNSHLIPLRDNIDAVKYSSDLSTIRWDIIDPEILVSIEPSAQRPVTPPRTPVSKGICHSPALDYEPEPQVVFQSPPSLALERNASNADIEQVDDDMPEPVVIQIPPTSTRGPIKSTRSTSVDVVISPRQEFQCEWANCHHVLSDIWSFRLHVAKHHVLVNYTCGWANCECDLCLSGLDLWDHVEKAHIELPE